MTTPSGVIASGTQNVILYCICMEDNVAVSPTYWFIDGTAVTLTEDDGSGNPYFRDNVPSPLIIPSFVTPHNGMYGCGSGTNFNTVSSNGDTITLDVLPGTYICIMFVMSMSLFVIVMGEVFWKSFY